ncbi:RNA pseudouridylate synthase domain-containing protein 1-like [Euwallacea similis]|uniref:RNA pseudouridylate synthase domain-containing protein 1-like n=1 Tax=Euwallacea similis TaxID=1736056 RepID=UPI00344DE133
MIIELIYTLFCISIILLIRFYRVKHQFTTSVAFSNKHYIVVNKQPDLKINSNQKYEPTLQTYLRQTFPNLANKNLYHEFYFPHRLDFATSGLLCIPKTKEACKAVSSAFSGRTTRKYYLALVRGWLSKDLVDINIPIGEDGREPHIQKMCAQQEALYCRNSRVAQTIITILEEGVFNNFPTTKILCRPISGRRHQIRVHCSSIGHTIVGDYTYSNRKDVTPARMYLHSLRLHLPNKMGDIDVATKDPFVEIKDWRVFRIIKSIDLAYSNLDDYIKASSSA